MYQQKIPLRGSEASLNLFTELLRELKRAAANSSSADVLLAAVLLWRNRPSTLKAECTASSRCDGQTHAFHLQGIMHSLKITLLSQSQDDLFFLIFWLQ